MVRLQEPKIVHQGVDTLVISYKCLDIQNYLKFYQPLLSILESKKSEAQMLDDFGTKFVKSDLNLGLGDFFVSSKGNRQYKFYIENQDFLAFLSTASIDSSFPNIQVHFRANFLFRVGLKKAIDLVEVFIQKALGSKYSRDLNRVDLATDVWGVRYTKLDSFRFQTKFSQKDFVEVADIKTFGRFYRVQGFTFGSGDKLFRIYDKSQKIKNSPSESYIEQKWRLNGYCPDKKYPVFRHEFQIRGKALRQFIPNGFDSVKWLLDNTGKLWRYGNSLLEFVEIDDNDIIDINNGLTSVAITKRFQRAKKRGAKDFWDSLAVWDNRYVDMPKKYKDTFNPNIKLAKKYLKAFISATYKSLGTNPYNLSYIIDEVQRELFEFDGINLHQYALSKVADSFTKFSDYILEQKLNPTVDYSDVLNEALFNMRKELININNLEYRKKIEKALEVFCA